MVDTVRIGNAPVAELPTGHVAVAFQRSTICECHICGAPGFRPKPHSSRYAVCRVNAYTAALPEPLAASVIDALTRVNSAVDPDTGFTRAYQHLEYIPETRTLTVHADKGFLSVTHNGSAVAAELAAVHPILHDMVMGTNAVEPRSGLVISPMHFRSAEEHARVAAGSAHVVACRRHAEFTKTCQFCFTCAHCAGAKAGVLRGSHLDTVLPAYLTPIVSLPSLPVYFSVVVLYLHFDK